MLKDYQYEILQKGHDLRIMMKFEKTINISDIKEHKRIDEIIKSPEFAAGLDAEMRKQIPDLTMILKNEMGGQ